MLLNNISCEIDQLRSHFSGQLIHPSNFKVLNVSEFASNALKYALFEKSLKTLKVIESEFLVASFWRVSLMYCR